MSQLHPDQVAPLMFDINGGHSPAAAATTVRANDGKAHLRAATIKANGNYIRHEKARWGDLFAETLYTRGDNIVFKLTMVGMMGTLVVGESTRTSTRSRPFAKATRICRDIKPHTA
ncbi:MAG: hypothetical protein Q9175_004405 [Cornicularia normoerica]